ncbi:MAG: hypothetical protein ABR541_03405 [Candidatus Dormibacteria bacterium]
MPYLRSMLIRRTVLAGTVLTLATVGAGGAYMHLAASPSSSASSSAAQPGAKTGHARHHRHGRHHLLGELVRITAKDIGQTPEQVVTQLKAGKTLDQIAGAKAGAVRQDALALAKTRLDRAVSRGRIDGARETALLTKLGQRLDTVMSKNLSAEVQRFDEHPHRAAPSQSAPAPQASSPPAAA